MSNTAPRRTFASFWLYVTVTAIAAEDAIHPVVGKYFFEVEFYRSDVTVEEIDDVQRLAIAIAVGNYLCEKFNVRGLLKRFNVAATARDDIVLDFSPLRNGVSQADAALRFDLTRFADDKYTDL